MSYKLTKKAEADLAALIDFSLERFGSDTALRHLDKLERSIEALDRGDFEGPELHHRLARTTGPPMAGAAPLDLLRPRRWRAACAPHLSRRSRATLTNQ